MLVDSKPDFNQINKLIQQLHQADFKLILATAKTAHELIALNAQLNLPGPFIVENGGGILFRQEHGVAIPKHATINIGSYRLLKRCGSKPDITQLQALCDPALLVTYMSDITFARITGLSLIQAALAKIRYFTELIYIKELAPSQLKSLKNALRHANIYFTQTTRFLHTCTTKYHHKGAAVNYIMSTMYNGISCQTFAIGNDVNDYSMLKTCDHAFYISPHPSKQVEKYYLNWPLAIEAILNQAL